MSTLIMFSGHWNSHSDLSPFEFGNMIAVMRLSDYLIPFFELDIGARLWLPHAATRCGKVFDPERLNSDVTLPFLPLVSPAEIFGASTFF